MGRQNEERNVKSNPEVRALYFLVDILEESGLVRNYSDSGDCWDRLSDSLESLSNRLQDRISSASQAGERDIHENRFLETEVAAQQVRFRVSVLADEIGEIPPILQLCQNLGAAFPRLRPLSKSLNATVCERQLVANDILLSITQTLEALYIGNKEGMSTISDLRLNGKRCRRHCGRSNSSPWKDIFLLLKLNTKRELGELGSATSDSNDDVQMMKNCDVSQEICQTKDEPHVLQATILDVVEAFVADSQSALLSLLVVGPEGSGKTFCCNEIEKVAKSRVQGKLNLICTIMLPNTLSNKPLPTIAVIRPSLPFDLTGRNVGSAEDLLVSLISCTGGTNKSSIIIVDDIETIFGYSYETSAKSMAAPSGGMSNRDPHITARLRATLLCLLDQLRRKKYGTGILLVCTSIMNIGKSIGRFDRIFTLSSPGMLEREAVIYQYLNAFEHLGRSTISDTEIRNLLLNLVECTSGISHAQLAQYCRQAILVGHQTYLKTSLPGENLKLKFLKALKHEVQLSMPESLRRGITSDFVDMKVMSAKDLEKIPRVTVGGSLSLPIYGESGETAWQEIMRTIVMPLCQVEALQTLLDKNGGQSGKTFAGGVLLTGDPGCGKSALAYHAATVASSMNPSIKLVEVSCTSLISKEVGSSERSIHHLFEAVRAATPCILLMDGIETVAGVRGNDNTTEGTMDRVLSTLLTELDGVDSEEHPQKSAGCLAIIGICQNTDWVDPALRRPGRFGKVIEVGRPEHEARKSIVLRELSGSQYANAETGVNDGYHGLESLAEFVAKETEGLTGAAILAVCDDAKVLSSKASSEGQSWQPAIVKPGHLLAAIKARRAGIK